MNDRLDVPFQIKAVSDDGLFSGYGSVFGVIDSYKEVVAPGAFTKSLQRRTPSLLWQHRSSEPIGVYTSIREDQTGLYVEGKLALKTARGAEAYELLKMGAISGLSIGFLVKLFEYINNGEEKVRRLTEIDLWEVSLVTFPANDAARVSGVKSIDTIASLSDAESYLRDAGGLSRREATALVSRIKSLRGRGDPDELGELLALANRRGVF